jgi:hypothetical protein
VDYKLDVVGEFEKIASVPNDAELILWFEDDLFCQVNLWFICHLIKYYKLPNPVFLVRPTTLSMYGFAAYDQGGLRGLFANRISIDRPAFAGLWQAYQTHDLPRLERQALQLNERYGFVLPAVQALIESYPTEKSQGRPKDTLLRLTKELGTTKFGKVFQAFYQEEAIYGFGDLQVKRLMDELGF